MKGILIIGHGDMPKGMIHSAKMFFGDEIEAMDSLCLYADTSVELFAAELETKIRTLDDGDGVIVLADLFGGSPCNQAILKLTSNVDIISGMNFGMLLEVLATREAGVFVDVLIETGRNGILNVKEQLMQLDEDDE